MKRQMIWLLTLLFCSLLALHAYAEESPPPGLDPGQTTAELQAALDRALADDPDGTAFSFSATAEELMNGAWSWDAQTIVEQLARLLFGSLRSNLTLLIQIIVIAVLSGILCNLHGSFAGHSVGEIGFVACYFIIAGLTITVFVTIVQDATDAIDRMNLFMQSMIPSLITISAAGGNTVTAATMSPTLLFSMQAVTLLARNCFLPMILVLAAMTAMNNLTGRFQLSRLVDLLRSIIKWGLGFVMTIFIGILSMQGLTSSMADGIAGKTVKFAVGSFVPLVGGVLSESVEAVMSSASILKNAVGVAGMLALCAMCAGPLIKLIAMIAVYKFSSGVAEPVTDKRITAFLSDLSGNITLVFVILLVVSVLFIISVALLCLAGNFSVAVRT